jgi:flagellar biosynthesis activator protein FlaF
MSETNFDSLSIQEKDAFGLSRAALALDKARDDKNNPSAMVSALNHNLELWVAIRSFVSSESNNVPADVRENLLKLGQYVAEMTFKSADGLSEQDISSLININLQISEGLLEGAKA